MPEEKIYESGEAGPDDDFWLEQGKKIVEGSFSAVEEGAKSIITGIELLLGIYLAILGFTDIMSEGFNSAFKSLFLIPLLFWMIALYAALQVVITQRVEINLHSPDDIQNKYKQLLLYKQKNIMWSYWAITIGLLSALLLLLYPLV